MRVKKFKISDELNPAILAGFDGISHTGDTIEFSDTWKTEEIDHLIKSYSDPYHKVGKAKTYDLTPEDEVRIKEIAPDFNPSDFIVKMFSSASTRRDHHNDVITEGRLAAKAAFLNSQEGGIPVLKDHDFNKQLGFLFKGWVQDLPGWPGHKELIQVGVFRKDRIIPGESGTIEKGLGDGTLNYVSTRLMGGKNEVIKHEDGATGIKFDDGPNVQNVELSFVSFGGQKGARKKSLFTPVEKQPEKSTNKKKMETKSFSFGENKNITVKGEELEVTGIEAVKTYISDLETKAKNAAEAAQTEIDELKTQIEEIRKGYEDSIKTLEGNLKVEFPTSEKVLKALDVSELRAREDSLLKRWNANPKNQVRGGRDNGEGEGGEGEKKKSIGQL